jgi:hypothetical protein
LVLITLWPLRARAASALGADLAVEVSHGGVGAAALDELEPVEPEADAPEDPVRIPSFEL